LTTLTPESLAAEDLSSQAVIFCVNLPALAPAATEKLLAYVRGGGHAFWICGPNVQPLAYNGMNALAKGELLPATLGDLREPLPGGVESWHVGYLDRDDPALTALTEPASLYQSVIVTRNFPLTPSPQGARVLIKLEDGSPLLIARAIGAGSVLLLGTSLHTEWTNLPLRPVFLPLLDRLTFRLAGAEGERTSILAGAPATLSLGKGAAGEGPSAPEVEVVRPSGEVVRVRTEDLADRTLHYPDTYELGTYIVRQVDRRPPKQMAFAVNIDPAESDPTMLSREELKARLGAYPAVFCQNPDALTETIRRLREGVGLWEWFLAAVLIALVAEVYLANRHAEALAAESPSGSPSPAHAAGSTSSSAPEPSAIAAAATTGGDDLRGFLERLGQQSSPGR
jgi:hypothetical protein